MANKEKDKSIIKDTAIEGLYIVERPTFFDERGFFREVIRLSDLQEVGIDFTPVQWNHSLSKPNVIRALHAENWNKLVYPITGRMFAALVDIRDDSETFAKVISFEFDSEDNLALFISKGIANSICAVEGMVNYMYLVDAYYDGSDTKAVAWNDPDLAIDWPVENPVISGRDRNNPKLRDLYPDKFK